MCIVNSAQMLQISTKDLMGRLSLGLRRPYHLSLLPSTQNSTPSTLCSYQGFYISVIFSVTSVKSGFFFFASVFFSSYSVATCLLRFPFHCGSWRSPMVRNRSFHFGDALLAHCFQKAIWAAEREVRASLPTLLPPSCSPTIRHAVYTIPSQ